MINVSQLLFELCYILKKITVQEDLTLLQKFNRPVPHGQGRSPGCFQGTSPANLRGEGIIRCGKSAHEGGVQSEREFYGNGQAPRFSSAI